jgi:SAM-dependent methyltransferase
MITDATPPAHLDFLGRVREYYDRNTPRFVRSHQSAVAKAIHREVWGPGTVTEREAFEYVNRLVLQEIDRRADTSTGPFRVLDLGCGVGGTLFYLASRRSIVGVGVTLSPVGVRLAGEIARESGLGASCHFLEANYLRLPDVGPQDAVYAIESFLHGPDPAAFFRSAAAAMSAGARLMVCDDFLTEDGDHPAGRIARQDLDDFRRGWHVGSLVTPDQARRHALAAGLNPVSDQDLTPWLKLQRPCDRTIAVFVTIGRALPFRSPWWDSWVGGHAIQRCLLTGLIRYRFLVFEKP